VNPLVCAAIWCATVAEFPAKNQDRLPIEPKPVHTIEVHGFVEKRIAPAATPGSIADWVAKHGTPVPRKPGQSDLDYFHDFMSR